MKKSFLSTLLLVVALLTAGTSYGQVGLTATGGTVSQSYATLGDAFNAINAGTHTGDIAISITADIAETGPCVLNSSGAGSASYTSVLIQPGADAVTISGATATGRGLIELNGADYVTINGDNPNSAGPSQNMTIANTGGATFSSVIRLATSTVVTSADNNTIRNCILTGGVTGGNAGANTSTTAAYSNTMAIVAGGGANATDATAAPNALTAYTTGSTFNNLTINNNSINLAAFGIRVNGGSVTAANALAITNNTIGGGTAAATTFPSATVASTVYVEGIFVQGATTVTITGNTVQDVISYVGVAHIGIDVNATIGTGVTVSNNNISGIFTNVGNFTARGISVAAATGAYTIGGNMIANIQNTAGSATTTTRPAGIYVATTAPSGILEKNNVSTIYSRNTGTFGVTGMWLAGGNNITVRNNFVWDINENITGAGAFSTQYGIHGISVLSGTGHKIYNNSVNLSGACLGTPASAILISALTINATTQTGMDVRNNILANTMTGPTTGSAIVSLNLPSGGTSSMNLTCNNNVYYCGSSTTNQGIAQKGTASSAATLYLPGNFNSATTTPATNLTAYTSTLGVATNDNASVALTTGAPFISATNLHIASGTTTPIQGAGASVAVTDDIDGDVRIGSIDIGADQFIAAPVCSGQVSAGTATAGTASFCLSGSTTITLNGYTSGVTGVAIQWQSSADSVTFTNITGATGPTYNTFTITATTYYRAIVTCSNSLTADSATVKVRVNPLPVVSVSPDGGIICTGAPGPSMTASGAATYTWLPATGLNTTTGATVTASPATTTTYTITGTSPAGCVNTHTLTINVINAPSLSVSPTNNNICAGGQAKLVAIRDTTTVATTTISSGAISLVIPDNASAGNFNSINVALPANAVITGAYVTFNGNMTYDGDLILNLTAPNGHTLNLFYRKGIDGDNFVNTVISSAGTNVLPATLTNNFTDTYAADAVSAVGDDSHISNETSWTGLYGTPNGTWTFSARDAANQDIATFTDWSLTLSYAVPFVAPAVWSPATGLYTDAGLTALYAGSPADTVYASPATSTYYTANATYNGCTSTAPDTVTVNLPDAGSITGPMNVLPGSYIQLGDIVTGGTWSSTSPSVATVSGTGLVTGAAAGIDTINYTVTNACGTIVAGKAITVISTGYIRGTNYVCVGGSITLTDSAGTPGGTWSCTDGDSLSHIDQNGMLTGIAQGVDTILYTVGGYATRYRVTVYNNPVVNAGADVAICSGSSTTLTPTITAAAGYAFSWAAAPGMGCTTCMNTTVSPGATQYYVLKVTKNSCVTRDTVVVTVNPQPNPGIISGASTAAAGATIALSTTGTSGTWSSTNTDVATVDNNGLVTDLTPGTDTIKYTVTTACATAVAKKVVQFANTGYITGPGYVCVSATTTLVDSAGTSGGVWSSTSAATATVDQGGVITGVAPGTTIVKYTVYGRTAQKTITVYGLPGVSASNDTAICNGTSAMLSANSGTAGAGFSWLPSGSVSCYTCATITAHPAATTTYTVTASKNTCTSKAMIVVTVNPQPNAGIITGASAAVTGATITLHTTGDAGGTWSSMNTDVATVDNNGVVADVTAGSVYIKYGVTNGCGTVAASKQLTFTTPGTVTGPKYVCARSSIQLTDSAGTPGGVWSTTDATATVDPNSGVVTGVSAGTATIRYTINFVHVQKTISVFALPTVNAGDDRFINAGDTIMLAGTGDASSYTWGPATGVSCTHCLNPSVHPTDTKSYVLTGTKTGCSATDTVVVFVGGLSKQSAPTGISAISAEATVVKVYPNPTRNELNMELNANNEDMHITLIDVAGRTVAEIANTKQATGNQHVMYNASSFASGIYYVHIELGAQVVTQKVVIE